MIQFAPRPGRGVARHQRVAPMRRVRMTPTDGMVRRAKLERPRIRPVAQLGEYEDGLGFSLKPPKFVRRAATAVKRAVTIKNVAKAAAVGAAIFAAPVLLPALAHGAVAAGGALARGAAAGAKFIRGSAAGLRHRSPKNGEKNGPASTGATWSDPPESQGPGAMPGSGARTANISPGNTEAAGADGGSGGGYGYSGGGGDIAMPSAQAAPTSTEAAAPDIAGMTPGSSLPMIGLAALGAMLLLKGSGPKRRRSRRRK